MPNSTSYLLKLLLVIMVIVQSTCFATDREVSKPEKRALLIGIDEYKSPSVSPLRGAVNDVRLMRELLIGKFGIAPENIKVLENGQATREAIIDTISNHLIDKTGKDDVVILHFSGHGSQMEDASGDEVDKLDETLVPHDSRTPGIYDITDDEINELLLQLSRKTKNVTFIFDSCHSGAATRGGNSVRKIEPDTRKPPSAIASAVSVRGAESMGDFRSNNLDYVLISGSLAKELSNETSFEGRQHGVLTWFLASALKAAPDRTTYRDIMDQVKAEVTARFLSQHPQIEGPGQDLVVFGVDKINVKPYVLVEPSRGKDIRVDAGKVFGVSEESVLKVYPPRTADFDRTKSVATLKIKNATDFEAEAEITEGGPIQPQSRALLEAISFGDTSIPVFIDVKGPSGKLSSVKAALTKMPAITFAKDMTDARLIVNEKNGKVMVQSGDLEWLVPPVLASEADIVPRVTNQIKDLVHWLVIFDLKNPGSSINVGLDIWRIRDLSSTPYPATVSSGTVLSYSVENRHSHPLYIYVLDVSSDGSVTLLYPHPGNEQQQLPAGKKLQERLKMFVPRGQSAVTDVLKVIATVKPIDPSLFPLGPIRSASEEIVRTTDPLAKFLATALRGAKAATPVSIDMDSWVTVQKAIRVEKEDKNSPLSSFIP